ncbi:polyketide synthase [Mycolicibacterium agri]|uniref:Polyketide synthase n=1 Tax=Mycolicibacterium agri TaxID=36811 RepID=A0A2A7N2B7_MYCAG|nr:type I polyketide synthase [Mycolicibacterium agri]PEG37907.1 polyketide synthase [Mycolicibacterium agri]
MRTTFSRISDMTAAQRAALDDQFEKASRLAAAEPIAVIGIGCRFPGGSVGPQAYWEFLADGGDAIGEVPSDRWDVEEFYDPDPFSPGRMSSKWAGFLPDVSGFDADHFGISPREAETMDPQQRLLLEVAWEALEHGGFAPEAMGGSRTAVMMGVYYTEYQTASAANPDAIDAYCATGNAHSITVGRIAYLLGLHGPAVAVDTACSSSLVAVHLACQSLRMRESDVALAGGVNLILRPETQLALSKWGMLSPHGHCRSFDAGADGFVRGEGAGVVVLKRLTDAVCDGDRVLAVVRGSAVNQDGRSNGLTAPNALAQHDVITRALRGADVAAGSVNFVEAHGTGTALGDPIEFDALSATYGQGNGPCAVGAVKTNMGHLEGAAGIAGFIKAVLAVHRAQIPPNLHFLQWNPAIDASATRLFVPTDLMQWPDCSGPRRAAVSSFGLGGTNAHVVLEQGPDMPASSGGSSESSVSTLVVTGRTTERVSSWATALADWLERDTTDVELADLARTLRHRQGEGKFAAVCAVDRQQAVTGLRTLAAGVPAPGVVLPREAPAASGTVFVYSGQGSQWAGMGRQLMADEPAFAAAIADLEPVFVAQVGFSLRKVLTDGEQLIGIDRIQPVLVGMHLALTELWRHHGVRPDAVIGHSMGEVSAAVVAGALTPADGLRVIATRSRLMSRLSGQGAMALLELDAAATEELMAGYPDITLAVYASPRQTVVAGPPAQVDAMIAVVDAQGRLARRIEVDVASHHPTIDPILFDLRSALADLTPSAPQILLFSTTGNAGRQTPVFDAGHWVANLRHPVRFSQAVAIAGAKHANFVEVSPHPLLTHAITETLEFVGSCGDIRVAATINRDSPETITFHANLSTVHFPVDAESCDEKGCDGGSNGLVDLPPRPWMHSKYWVNDRADGRPTGMHPMLGMHVEMPQGRDHAWQADVGTDLLPWLQDHKVHGQPVMPAAAFAEIALAAGCEAFGLPADAVTVNRLEVEQMLPVESRTQLTTVLNSGAGNSVRVEVYSRSTGGTWCRHAVACVHAGQGAVDTTWNGALGDTGTIVSPVDFYTALRRTGAHHGRAFAALTRIIHSDNGFAEAEIALPDDATSHREFRVHPVMFDAALQTLAAAMPTESQQGMTEVTYLPVAMETIRVHKQVGRRGRCRAELINVDDTGAVGRITLLDDTGAPTASISGVYLRRVNRRAVPLPLAQKLFDSVWRQTPLSPDSVAPRPCPPAGSWLVLTHGVDMKDIAEDFTTGFATSSRRVITANLGDESAVLDAFAKTAADPDLPPVGVVIFVGQPGIDGMAPDDEPTRARDVIWAVSAAVRAIVSGWHGKSPRMWLVSRNGLLVHDDERGHPTVGALKGLIRVLAYEHPDLRATLVDLDMDADVRAMLTAELAAQGSDDVVAWRGQDRYAERLARATLNARVRDPVVRADGAYIITGGLGGVGMVVARWLVDSGAARVVLNGRSGPSESQRKDLSELEARAEVAVVCGDIAAPGMAERLVAAAEATGRPLRGIVHSAAVIDDQIVVKLTRESLERVWAAKAMGAWRLHKATTERKLDWWVGFSSVASLLGSPGQTSYACANAWLDALVSWRRASLLTATTINWGQWAEVGVASALNFGVLDPISPAEGIEALEAVLAGDLARVGVTRLRLDRAVAAFPEIQQLNYFTDLAGEVGSESDDDWPGTDALQHLDSGEVNRVVTGRLRRRVSAIMGYPDDRAVATDEPLTGLGMDSLMAVRIRNTVRGDFGVEPPVALLLQGASLVDVATELIGQLGLSEHDEIRPNNEGDFRG